MPAPVSGPVVAACVARGRPQNPGPVPGGAGGPLALRRRALRPRRPPRRGGGLAALACRLLLGPLAVSLAVVGALAGGWCLWPRRPGPPQGPRYPGDGQGVAGRSARRPGNAGRAGREPARQPPRATASGACPALNGIPPFKERKA